MSRQPQDLLYRDKIEVSLDGRQIFYLFFGGAVIVGLVFVLGVMVGRRVEARGHVDRARTTAAQDPLAALDRLESNGGMSFKGALMGAQTNSDVERQIAEIEKARKPDGQVAVPPAPKAEVKPEMKAEVKPEAKADAKPEAKPAEQKPVTKPDQVEKKVEETKVEKKSEDKKPDEKKVEAKTEDKKPEAKKPDEKKVEAKVEDKKPEAKSEDKKPEEKKADSEEKKSKFVLQLSSFQDRAEADAFLAQIKSAGYSPFITEGTVNGTKFYRVRMGSYKSMEAANDAKSEIEKTLKKSATVMKL
jgi:septal ring-binding cell division protein DamX